MPAKPGVPVRTPEQRAFTDRVCHLRELADDLHASAPHHAETCRVAADVLESLSEDIMVDGLSDEA